MLTRELPDTLKSEGVETYADKYIYFVTSEVDIYLIVGERKKDNGETASWAGLPSDEIRVLADNLEVNNFYCESSLYQKIEEYKEFATYLKSLETENI